MRIAVFASLAMCGALVGCMNESQPGGPGVKQQPAAPRPGEPAPARDTAVVDKDQTFKVAVPATDTDLKQGEREDVTISIDRGDNFNQNVKLQFKSPKGITVSPADAMIRSGDQKVDVTVEAAADATPGESNIEVIAVPETGKSVTVQMKVEVDEKEKS